MEVLGSDESLGHVIYKLSGEILHSRSLGGNTHARTMLLFEMLSRYRWDAKAVLMLSAFATSYGEFWLIMQLYPRNSLAASVALLRQLPVDLSLLKPRFKALSMLVKTIVDVTKCIIKFEELSVQRLNLDNEAVFAAKSQVYMATYWIIRSALTCSSQITDFIAMKMSNHSDSETIASWELSSLVCKLSTIRRRLQRQVDACFDLVESAMHQMLVNLFNETSFDNQEALELLFALNDNSPLKDCNSQAKVGVSELKNKVVILLISKPELMPVELLSFLVQKMFDHRDCENLEGSYEIVWVPVPSSDAWTSSEEQSFEFLSNHMPWFSLQKPWLLSSVVLRFIRQVWGFKEEPMMVVLDSNGRVTNLNAIDMVLTWGAKAYPFCTARESELWEDEGWNLRLLLDYIDPLVAKWVEQDQDLCVYGSNNIDWIREFSSKLRNITTTGLKIETVYVGKNNPNELVTNILRALREEKANISLSFEKINLFWLRLENTRRSKLRSSDRDDKGRILKELRELLATDGDNNEDWVIIGRGSSNNVMKLQGREAMEWLDNFPDWGKYVGKLGLVNAVRSTIEPALVGEPCNHSSVTPFVEGLDKTVICEKCKRPMERLVFYECDVTQ